MAKKKYGILKAEEYHELRRHIDRVVLTYGARDDDFQQYEDTFKLSPADQRAGKTRVPNVRMLFDPKGHNVINAVVQMYVVNPPSISVSASPITKTGWTPEQAEAERQERLVTDKIERWLKAALYASNLASARDFLAESIFAAAIYGELPQIIDLTYDEPDSEAPFIFEVPNPRTSYPVYSKRKGLVEHIIKEKLQKIEFENAYGEDSCHHITGDFDQVLTLVDYIDKNKHVVYCDEFPEPPILVAELPHGFIPRTSRISVSPGFFEEQEYRRMPLLFAYVKAGLWAARNTLYTATLSNTIDFMNPLMLYTKKLGGNAPLIDWSKRGSTVEIEQGESLTPLTRSSVAPEIFQMAGIISQMVDESTMPHITAMTRGQGGTSGTSALNILTAVSRASTFLIQRTVELATAQTLSKTLRWIKARGDEVDVWGEEGKLTIAASEIGDNFHVVVDLKPDVQAEKQMVAGLAATLFERLHLGYDTVLEMLEQAGIVDSANQAFENIVERAMIEAELPKMAKEMSGYARSVFGAAEKIPEAMPGEGQTPMQPEMPVQPSQAVPPAPGGEPGPRDTNPTLPPSGQPPLVPGMTG